MTKRRWWPIEPEAFYLARAIAGMTRSEAATFLRVSQRTVRNWEAGRAAIPYPAFRLLRIFGGFDLPGWDGWRIHRGTLWSPEGKAFRSEDMAWWGLTVAMARSFAIEHGATRDPAEGWVCPLPDAAARRAAQAGGRGEPAQDGGKGRAAALRRPGGGRPRTRRSPALSGPASGLFPPSGNTGGKVTTAKVAKPP